MIAPTEMVMVVAAVVTIEIEADIAWLKTNFGGQLAQAEATSVDSKVVDCFVD